jgi:hypothetical protein
VYATAVICILIRFVIVHSSVRARSTDGTDQMCIQNFGRKSQKDDTTGVDARIILSWIFRKQDVG